MVISVRAVTDIKIASNINRSRLFCENEEIRERMSEELKADKIKCHKICMIKN